MQTCISSCTVYPLQSLLSGFLSAVCEGLRWNLVQAESTLIYSTCRAAPLSAWDPGPMGRKHVQRTICNGKTNPVKDFVDFAARGNGVQLPRVLVTDAFSPSYLANMHVPLYPPVALDSLNLDAPSPFTDTFSSTFSRQQIIFLNTKKYFLLSN